MRAHEGSLCSRHSGKDGCCYFGLVSVLQTLQWPRKHAAVAVGALKTAWLAGRNAPVGSALGRGATEGEPRGRGCGPQGLFFRWLLLWRGL